MFATFLNVKFKTLLNLRKSLNLYLQEEDFQKKITHDKLVCLLKDVEEKFYEKKKLYIKTVFPKRLPSFIWSHMFHRSFHGGGERMRSQKQVDLFLYSITIAFDYRTIPKILRHHFRMWWVSYVLAFKNSRIIFQ